MEQKIERVIEELSALAAEQGGSIQAGQLKSLAEKEGLGNEEVLKVLTGLKKQRITVEVPLPEGNGAKLSMEEAPGQKKLTPEERIYVDHYRSELEASGTLPELMRQCLPEAFELAGRYYREEILWEDLVQETCFALFTAVEESSDKKTVLRRVEEGIVSAIGERVSEKQSDQALINQVEKLEEAVRELNEGEGEKFTIQELAIILDMDVETIHDILKLTGDDDGQSGEGGSGSSEGQDGITVPEGWDKI